jgi:ubiquinone/menaquinone biosynthesis C-methylase UbiE
VLDIAVGTGLNLPHYPDGVRLTGIDFVPAMLDIARRRAVELGRPVELRLGDAQALEFEAATFDTVLLRSGYVVQDITPPMFCVRLCAPGGSGSCVLPA